MRRSRHFLAMLVGLWALVGWSIGAAAPPDRALVAPTAQAAPASPKGKALGHVPGRLLVKLKSPAAVLALPMAPGGVAVTDDDVLAKVRGVQGFKAMRPQFPGTLPPKAGQKLMARDGKLLATPDLTRWHCIDLEEAEDVLARVAEVKQIPGVDVVEPDYLRKMADVAGPTLPDATTDPDYAKQWHLAAVHAPEAWAHLKTPTAEHPQGLPPGGSRDVIVAVIDTGIDMTHPDLSANLWTNSADGTHGYNAITGTNDPTDDNGHGTHVAGIIAAQGNNAKGGVGIAYNVQVMAIKAAQYSGVLAASDIAKGITWAVAHGADVINMSFGGYGKSQAEEDALAVAFGQAVLVAAAGNDGIPNEPVGMLSGRPMYPAAYNWVLGVMASTQTPASNGDYLAAFSNWDPFPNNTVEYELMAPGKGVWSTLPNNQYAAWSGTSMATPVVAGIAALVRTKFADKAVYSSRFIMGQLAATGGVQQAISPDKGDPWAYHAADALAALTNVPKPQLSYLQSWIFDGLTQSPTNTPNGRVDAGETIDLAIAIRNQWGKADNVSVKIEPLAGVVSADPYVTMVTDTVSYGAVGAFSADDNGLTYDATDAVNGVSHPFTFTVRADTPNGHVIPFKVTITAANGFDAGDSTIYTAYSAFNLIVSNGKSLSSIITKDMTLTKDTLWILPDATLIQEGVTVTITEGTRIQFYSSESLAPYSREPLASLIVRGTLQVQGSLTEPVMMFLADPYRGRIIHIEKSGNGKVSLSYVVLENPSLSVNDIDHGKFVGTGQIEPWPTINGTQQFLYSQWYIDANSINKSIFKNISPDLLWSNLGSEYLTDIGFKIPNSNNYLNLNESIFENCSAGINFYNNYLGQNKYFTKNVLLNNAHFKPESGIWVRSVLYFGQPKSESLVQGLTFNNNAILTSYCDPNPGHWMLFSYWYLGGINFDTSIPINIDNNYWGTSSNSIIEASFNDFHNNFNKQELVYKPVLSTAPASTYPFVVDVTLSSGGTNVEKVGSEVVCFTVAFNRDMNQTVQPEVSFGPAEPYTDYPIKGDWKDARTWVGTFAVNPITGDGYQYLRVAGAQAADDAWLVTGDDKGRFRFEIVTSGTESMNLQASGAEGKVSLSWTQNDFEQLAGYHVYRSTSAAGTYARVNATIIPPQTPSYQDTSVNPGQPYYYKFVVVKTDLSESQFSNVATGTALDTVPPVISHTPVTTSAPGLALSFSAQVTDNVAVQGVQLFYRRTGTATFASRAMTLTTGSTYTVTLEGSLIASPGLDYYLVATDGITPVTSPSATSPYQVVVVDQPTVTSISPVKGPASGATAVTISGTNFKSGATVTFGGAIASSVTVVSANQITCVSPAHFPVAADVVVTNSDAQAGTLLRAFTYQSDTAAISLPTQTAGQNAVVQIPLSGATLDGLAAADVTLTYDSSILRIRTVTTGAITSGWGLFANTATAGQVRLSLASSGGTATGSGTLAFLEFDVLGAPGTSTALTLTSVKLNGGAIASQTANGTLNVQQVYSVSGTATHWYSGAAIPAVQLQLAGSRTYTATASNQGAFTVSGADPGNYTLRPSKSSDPNGISAMDASLVLQHAVGLITLTGYAAQAADVDKSGSIDAMDAYYILQKAAGLLTLPFPGAGVVWEFSPAAITVSSLSSNLTNQNFTGLLLGDVSGNWASTEVAGGATVDLRVAEALPVDKILTATSSLGPQGQSVYSLDLVLSYDASKGIPKTVTRDTANPSWLLSANLNKPGEIRVSMASAQPIKTDAALLGVTFDTIGTADAVGLTVKSASINESLLANVQYALQVTKTGAGSGTVTSQPVAITDAVGTANFNAGTLVTLTATPAIGSRFAGWSGAATGTALTTTVTLDAARQVIATFLQLTPPTLTWADPAPITYGTALSASQYNASASLPGTFAYTPALGTVLNAGAGQVLSTTFTATDTQYLPVTKTVQIDVAKAPQTVTFSPVTGLVAGGSAVALQAISTSGLPVTFSSSNPSVLAISGSTATPLAPGSAVVTASQAGDSNRLAAPDASQSLTIAPNPGGPSLALSMLSDKATTPETVLSITGQIQSPNGLGTVTVNGDTATLQTDGTFRAAVRLSAGSNTIAIHAVDAVGHATDSTRTVTLDEAAPKVTITTPPDNAALAASTVHVTGQVVPGGAGTDAISTLTWSLSGGPVQTVIPSGGAFAFDLTPGTGLNHLELTATTVAGKKSQAKATFQQQSAFSLAITEPARDITTTESSYLLKGTIADSSTPVTATITLGSQQYTPTVTGGAFQQTLTLDANKVWPVIVSAKDGQNRTLTVQRNIIRIPLSVPTFTLDDATAASRFTSGAATPGTSDLSKYDVAPLVNTVPTGDGKVDIEDLVVIFRKAMGLPL